METSKLGFVITLGQLQQAVKDDDASEGKDSRHLLDVLDHMFLLGLPICTKCNSKLRYTSSIQRFAHPPSRRTAYLGMLSTCNVDVGLCIWHSWYAHYYSALEHEVVNPQERASAFIRAFISLHCYRYRLTL